MKRLDLNIPDEKDKSKDKKSAVSANKDRIQGEYFRQ